MSTALTAVVSLATVPLLLAGLGVGGWGAIALGQAIGFIGSILCSWGWALSGAGLVGSLSEGDARRELRISVRARGVLLVPSALVSASAAAVFARVDPLSSAGAAVATCSVGMASTWFFVGRSRPGALLLFETLPRQVGALIGALLAAWTSEGLFYGAAVFGGGVLSVGLVVRLASSSIGALRVSDVWSAIVVQRQAFFAALASGLYLGSPVVIVGLAGSVPLAQFALADRLYKMANTATNPITQLMQARVASLSLEDVVAVRRTWVAPTVVGLGVALLFLAGAPLAAFVLSGGAIQPDPLMYYCLAGALAASTTSQVVGLVSLVVIGRVDALSKSAILGASLGVPMMFALVHSLGGVGVAVGFFVSELAVVTYQLSVLRSWSRGRRQAASVE